MGCVSDATRLQQNISLMLLSSCYLRTVLLYLEDLDLLYGSLWAEDQVTRRLYLCLHCRRESRVLLLTLLIVPPISS
jgi:hypothetical protein